jgi:hypothetical protein
MNPIVLPDLPLHFFGDHHGDWRTLLSHIQAKNLENSLLFSVGDVGMGFQPRKSELLHCQNLNQFFKSKNIRFLAIRGNHDDPDYFNSPGRVALSHFELLADYTLLQHRGMSLQVIGGGISIDRTGRIPNRSYWPGEGVDLQPELLQKVDILVTHTAPSRCFPQHLNQLVLDWARQDPSLLEELPAERKLLDEILEKTKPQHHFYGHFHACYREEIEGCTHKLLHINELYPSPSNLP